MKKVDGTRRPRRLSSAALDALIEEITVDAYGEDEQLWAFRQAFEDNITVPCDGFIIGEPVSVIKFDYDGNNRRGLTAKCRRADGGKHVVAVADLTTPCDAEGARYLGAYRRWMGLAPYPSATPASATPEQDKTRSRPATDSSGPGGPIELAVISVMQKAAHCLLLGSDRSVTLRASRPWDIVPGEIAVVRPRKQWTYGGRVYLSGDVESTRLDAAALALVPLRLEDRGLWDPNEHYWGDRWEPIEEWAKPIIARGQRRAFEMEQVLPGADSEDLSDPIIESNDRKDSGDGAGAYKILMDLCKADLRCLDAHAHLGNLVFDQRPEDAIRHYEAGLRIGELSLGEEFDGLLPWGRIDNRPFLRCMNGFGLCLWRLGRFEDAERIFDQMLWLNPSDNQGVRFLIDEVQARVTWENSRNK